MSTNAAIAMKTKEGYVSIYSHWDGYPDYLGTLLHAHYRSPEKVKKLISLGSISVLAEMTEPRKGEVHNFDKPLNHVTVAYARDRGEKLSISRVKSLTELKYGEFLYVFIPSTREWETYKAVGIREDYTREWKKLDNVDYDKSIKKWIKEGNFSIHPRGYDKVTGEKVK